MKREGPIGSLRASGRLGPVSALLDRGGCTESTRSPSNSDDTQIQDSIPTKAIIPW